MKTIARFALLPALLIAFAPSMFADGLDIYNNIPGPLPPNIPSLGYEAVSASEFGGLILFAGSSSAYSLDSATVAMSNWAYGSEWPDNPANSANYSSGAYTSAGFYVPLTLNLYNVGPSDSVGALIYSETVDAFIPWRPEPTPSTCAAGSNNDYLGSDGTCYAGSLSTVKFNLAGVTVPNQIIYGLAYNTTNYGASPTGVPGPYDSLNFGLSDTAPTVGSQPLPDTAYWNTSYAGFLDTGVAGTFSQDAGWSPYSGAIEFTEPTPEPSSLLLFGTGIFGLASVLYRRNRKSRPDWNL